MKFIRHYFLIFTLCLFIALAFFYKSLLNNHIPFPGDTLVGSYTPYNFKVVTHKAQGPDVVRQLFPWKHFVVENFKNLEIPFWNPYSLSGNPLMANFQSGSFYPLILIFFIFNFQDSWTIFIILSPILACFFTYLFLRELGLKTISGIFAGLAFGFSSYMVVWMEYGNVGHTFLWLPLILLVMEKFIKKQRFIFVACLSIISTTALLAGYIQGYFYTIFVGIIYFVGRSILLRKISKRLTILFLIGLIAPLFLSATQLLPTIELFQNSARGNYSLEQIDKLLNPVWYLITVAVPNFFGHPAARNSWFYGTYIERVSYFGLIPFILACYAFFNFVKRKEILIFGGLLVFSLFLATNLFFNKFVYLIPFPLLSTTVPTRVLSIFVFCGSVLAGFGLEFLMEKTNKRSIKISTGLIWIAIILLWIFVFLAPVAFPKASWLSNLSVAKRNLIIPTSFLLLFSGAIYIYLRWKNLKNIILASLFLLTFLDLFYFFHKITPFSPKEYTYPRTDVLQYLKNNSSINRFWGYGSGYIESNFSTFEGIYSTDGYEPLHIKRYGELISSSKDGSIPDRLPGSDANIHPGYGKEDLRKNAYRQRLLDLLGVKYILNKNDSLGIDYIQDNAFSEEVYRLVWQKAPWQIYENMNALPRVFLASDYVVESNKDKIVQMIFDKKLDLKNKIILEENISPKISFVKDDNAKVEVKKYAPNKIVLQTSAKSNMLLFLSDNYYPDWKVSIDGKDGKIYRANYSFRAVPIANGKHDVVFSYYPDSFDLGIKISFITIILLAIAIISSKFIKIDVQK